MQYMKTSAQSSIGGRGTVRRTTSDPERREDLRSSSCCGNNLLDFVSQLHGDLCFAIQLLCWACSATAAAGKE